MKTFMITLVAVAALGLASAQAQVTDTTRVKQTDPTYNPPTQPGNQYNQRDYLQIRSNEAPSSLRNTLKGSDYSGWENGMLYRNRTDNGYMLRMGEGADTRSFYFDKSGTKIAPPAGAQMQSPSPESQRTEPSTQPQYQQQPSANPQPNATPQPNTKPQPKK
jgi:hypothetical protein